MVENTKIIKLDDELFYNKLKAWCMNIGLYSGYREYYYMKIKKGKDLSNSTNRWNEDNRKIIDEFIDFIKSSEQFQPFFNRLGKDPKRPEIAYFLFFLGSYLFDVDYKLTEFEISLILFGNDFMNINYLSPQKRLLKNKILEPSYDARLYSINGVLYKEMFKKGSDPVPMAQDIFNPANIMKMSKQKHKNLFFIKENPNVDLLEEVKLDHKTKNSIIESIKVYKKMNDMDQNTVYKDYMKNFDKFVFLFHGESGTGKTMTARAIANYLNEPLYIVDIAKTQSKWAGENENLIRNVFKDFNKKRKGILLFDEADSLFGKRTENIHHSNDVMHNRTINIILQEIEKVNKLVILTTNHHGLLDKAFERRITLKVCFDRPQRSVREDLWIEMLGQLQIKNRVQLEKILEYSLTGSEIRNSVNKIIRYLIANEGNEYTSNTDLTNVLEDIIVSEANIKASKNIGFKAS